MSDLNLKEQLSCLSINSSILILLFSLLKSLSISQYRHSELRESNALYSPIQQSPAIITGSGNGKAINLANSQEQRKSAFTIISPLAFSIPRSLALSLPLEAKIIIILSAFCITVASLLCYTPQ